MFVFVLNIILAFHVFFNMIILAANAASRHFDHWKHRAYNMYNTSITDR